MTLPRFLVLACLLINASEAFSHSPTTPRRTSLSSSGPAEIPHQFDDTLLNHMQEALLTLEKCVKDGSLDVDEITDLDQRLHIILQEMKLNADKPLEMPPEPQTPAIPQIAIPKPTKAVESTTSIETTTPNLQAPTPAVTATGETIMDTSQDEGPVYDGKGGMGQPRGTVNTYIIDGMDEMTSDEYRLALQQSLIDRQRDRKKSGAAVGNRSTWNYLNQLTGESGVLKKADDSEE